MPALDFGPKAMSFEDWLTKTAEGFEYSKRCKASAEGRARKLDRLDAMTEARGAAPAEAATARAKAQAIRAKA